MLRIKLARFGKKNQPHYRIVINEGKSKRDGQYKEAIGTYVPTQEPKILQVDIEAFESWVKKGAQPSDTVKNLVERFKSGNPFPAKKPRPSKKAQAKAAAAASAKAEVDSKPVEEVAPTPEVEAEAPVETASEEVTEEKATE